MVYTSTSVDPTSVALLTRFQEQALINKIVGVKAIAAPITDLKQAIIAFELQSGQRDLIIAKIELYSTYEISKMVMM